MKLVNPFKPTAGAEPPVLIGRDKVIADFSDGLDEGVGSPARLMRITGPRGSGKTVLLTELGDLARSRGWEVVDETAAPDLLAHIGHALQRDGAHPDASADLDLGIVKAHIGMPDTESPSTLREALSRAAATYAGKHAGILVTIDEIQDADEDDVREIAAAVQHLIREKKNIAFVFAGITTGVMDLINGQALTFLRRAKAEELAAIPLDEVSDAFRETIRRSGLDISDGALAAATNATAGYAYLIQLVGYHIWRAAKAHTELSPVIDEDDVDRGIKLAMRDFDATVHETAIARLPLKAVEYLLAMAQDEGVSSTTEIACRLNMKPNALTSTRRMLIRRQAIESTARGFVTFSIPCMREFLLENKADILGRYGVSVD